MNLSTHTRCVNALWNYGINACHTFQSTTNRHDIFIQLHKDRWMGGSDAINKHTHSSACYNQIANKYKLITYPASGVKLVSLNLKPSSEIHLENCPSLSSEWTMTLAAQLRTLCTATTSSRMSKSLALLLLRARLMWPVIEELLLLLQLLLIIPSRGWLITSISDMLYFLLALKVDRIITRKRWTWRFFSLHF